MIEQALIGVVASGIGIGAAAVMWMFVNPLVQRYPKPAVFKAASFQFTHPRQWDDSDRASVIAGLIGTIFALLTTWGTGNEATAVCVFGVGMAVGAKLLFRWRVNGIRSARKRDIIILFETVELYMRAGMPLHHALAVAKVLTPSLRKDITYALGYWPSGPAKALEILRERIDLSEGDILASLLMQIDQVGIEHLEGVVRREGKRLEQMRTAADRARINARPLFIVMYRALPLMACLGMVAGTFFMYAMQVMREAGLFG
ncbi:MAG: hypothetical protein C4575_01930 [Desulforudis sp.]|nr:MAG: hypothetical protein C4575_01930 [Desulforudis sp.]